MTIGGAPPDWISAFPRQPVEAAAATLQQAWQELVRRNAPGFQPKDREDRLTAKLKFHCDTVARKRGLLGSWSAENKVGNLDVESGDIIWQKRTDISFHWNDDQQTMVFVFEFKKVSHTVTSRKAYLGDDGMGRFVDGYYSQDETAAAMVALLTGPEEKIVPNLQHSLSDGSYEAKLRQRKNGSSKLITQPSQVIALAAFDTDHDRSNNRAPIRLAHIFLGWPTP
ncbi:MULTISPECIES: hypothetical protein [Hyphomonas]|jgi:hypothetical protein|uniref:hypothetical protein n=1 Tax=Hyphomonas TaxID=85 RepID=UPI000555AA08|nr:MULTISPECIES: hypothetical protein [Hyphomonas]MBO6689489.1 Fis family transcriptional regulator [Henriciella sp.]KJS37615.1 MAG: hypothetical protein VR74_08065 [Hyphomonas sp. BRH_c22]MAL43026.1 Fis family transcriptional regulator [Hyphomonas sp.]MAX83418.1 Fis family transcriptional regulator [Hyphomonas sp.]HAO37982.1 Fis family transcriptional regulator [Hyphomonas sp.]|tara:strand:- start:1329 stop:2003 length:675 start_codon:yes stop_codon:yes gene_type:complete